MWWGPIKYCGVKRQVVFCLRVCRGGSVSELVKTSSQTPAGSLAALLLTTQVVLIGRLLLSRSLG